MRRKDTRTQKSEKTALRNQIGERIRQARETLGKGKTEMEKVAFPDLPTKQNSGKYWDRLEAGEFLTLENLQAISSALNVSIDFLVTGKTVETGERSADLWSRIDWLYNRYPGKRALLEMFTPPISNDQLGKMREQKIIPPISILVRICDEFNVSLDWLLTGEQWERPLDMPMTMREIEIALSQFFYSSGAKIVSDKIHNTIALTICAHREEMDTLEGKRVSNPPDYVKADFYKFLLDLAKSDTVEKEENIVMYRKRELGNPFPLSTGAKTILDHLLKHGTITPQELHNRYKEDMETLDEEYQNA